MTAIGPEISYVNDVLHIEDVALEEVLARHKGAASTPVYIYSLGLMRRRFEEFRVAVQQVDPAAQVCLAVKTLSNQAVLSAFRHWGAGADLVTRGELERVIRAGFAPQDVVFSGLGKTGDDLARAMRYGCQINCESLSELELAGQTAAALNLRGQIALRLNPQLDFMRAHLGEITTGKPDSKFGIPWDSVRHLLADGHWARAFPQLDLVGVSVHIGSDMTCTGQDADSFRDSFAFLTRDIIPALKAAGVPLPVRIDVGGGIGIDYDAFPVARDQAVVRPNRRLAGYVDLLQAAFGALVAAGQVTLVFEPGRALVGEAGLLLTRVLHVKTETEKSGAPFDVRFVIVDAGMNDLVRPSLYGAFHPVVPVRDVPVLDQGAAGAAECGHVDVCGAVCETTDSFMRPTRDWLGERSNILSAAQGTAVDTAAAQMSARLVRSGQRFGEVTPKFDDRGDHRVYEYFVKRRFPAALKAGDLLAILHAGAYGAVMASEYNTRPLVAELLVDGARTALIRPAPAIDEIISRDQVPDWLAGDR